MGPEARTRTHVWVKGRVQGVFYRESMRREAQRLGLHGWVRNLADGRVEAVIEGDLPAVVELVDWCRRGPEGATVVGMEMHNELPQGETGFRVLR